MHCPAQVIDQFLHMIINIFSRRWNNLDCSSSLGIPEESCGIAKPNGCGPCRRNTFGSVERKIRIYSTRETRCHVLFTVLLFSFSCLHAVLQIYFCLLVAHQNFLLNAIPNLIDCVPAENFGVRQQPYPNWAVSKEWWWGWSEHQTNWNSKFNSSNRFNSHQQYKYNFKM